MKCWSSIVCKAYYVVLQLQNIQKLIQSFAKFTKHGLMIPTIETSLSSSVQVVITIGILGNRVLSTVRQRM